MLRVQQLMTQNVHSCRADDTLERAARLMWDNDVGALPVVDESGKPIAMVTDRDACMAAYTRGNSLSEIRVRDVMSRSLFSVAPTDPVSKALELMGERQVRRLAVLDEQQRLVGIISQNDLIREAARQRENPDREISAVAVISALGAIGRPRYGAIAVSE